MDFFPLLQLTSITGIWGLSFSCMLFASGLALLWGLRGSRSQKTMIGFATGLFLVLVIGFGLWRLQTMPSHPTVAVGLLTSDLPENQDPLTAQATMGLFQRYADQIPPLAARGARLIVMPEHMASVVEDSLGGNAHAVDSMFAAFAARNNVNIVISVDHVVSRPIMWNQCRFYSPGGQNPEVYEEFFASCNKYGVRHLVMGGYAFALHAHPRYTGDMDLFVDHSEDNALRIIKALEDFGFSLLDLTWQDLATDGRVIQLGHPPLRIDLLTTIDGVEFEAAWARKVESRYGPAKIYVISKEDLIANKRASGHKQDLADLEDLTSPENP